MKKDHSDPVRLNSEVPNRALLNCDLKKKSCHTASDFMALLLQARNVQSFHSERFSTDCVVPGRTFYKITAAPRQLFAEDPVTMRNTINISL